MTLLSISAHVGGKDHDGGSWLPIPRKIDELASRPINNKPRNSFLEKNSIGDYAILFGLGIAVIGAAIVPFDGPAGEAVMGAAFLQKLSTM